MVFMQTRIYLVQKQVDHLGNCVVHGYSLDTSKPNLLHGGCRQNNSKLGEHSMCAQGPLDAVNAQSSGCKGLQPALASSSRPHTSPGLDVTQHLSRHSLGKLK